MATLDTSIQNPDVVALGGLPTNHFALVFMVTLVNAAGNTGLQAVIPLIGTRLNIPDIWSSLAFTTSAALWVVCAPFWAKQSDRHGRKLMMQVGMIGYTASFVACGLVVWLALEGLLAFAALLLLFGICRSIYGAVGSAAPPAVYAYVATRTDAVGRHRKMSLISSSIGLGSIVGPGLAPLVIAPPFGLLGPFVAFAVIGTGMIIAIQCILPFDRPEQRTVMAPEDTVTALAQISGRLRWSDSRIRGWILTGLLAGHVQAGMTGISGFLILDRLGLRATPELGALPISLVMTAGAGTMLAAQWFLIPMLRLQARASCLVGVIAAIVGSVIWAWSATVLPMAVGFAVASLGIGLMRPGFTAGASLAVPASQQGQVSGFIAAINGAPYIVGPTVAVWLYSHSLTVAFMAIEALLLVVLWIHAAAVLRSR